ncbi:MAG: hypothetical protein MUP22_09455 [Desulfobacterales bacterium]|nr:hypothetical protein [Desulfobacterales bacterium]
MQIIFLPMPYAIILCFILWPLFQTLPAYVCHKVNNKYFYPFMFFYRAHKWEKNGLIYKQLFKVNLWKRYLPESSSFIKGNYNKKSLVDFSETSLNKYLLESCRAEMIHWLAIIPFWIFGLFAPAKVISYMFIYAIAVNLPCIVVQRYNRPRIISLLQKNTKRD